MVWTGAKALRWEGASLFSGQKEGWPGWRRARGGAEQSGWHRTLGQQRRQAGRQGRQEASAPQPQEDPSLVAASPSSTPTGGEGTPGWADSSQPAWAPVPALPLTSCVVVGKLRNHFLLCWLRCKMEIIIALPGKAVVRREDACDTCLAHCGHLDVGCSVAMGVAYLCHLRSLQKEGYYEGSPLAHVS